MKFLTRIALLGALLSLTACWSSPQIQACYAATEARTWASFEIQCEGETFQSCSETKRLMAEHDQRMKACDAK